MAHGILIIEDEEVLARKEAKYLAMAGFDVSVAGNAAQGLESFDRFKPDAVILDFNLPGGIDGLECLRRLREKSPGVRVIMVTGHGSERIAVDAMKGGAFDYLSKPVVLSELKRLIEKAIEQDHSEGKLAYFHQRDAMRSGLDRILGDSPAIVDLKNSLVRIIEATDRIRDGGAPAVLIAGETGSGKELVARALHFGSSRASGPFIELNVAAIPVQLVESELFGYERGAFTDARARKMGLVEAADGGTLFLDEIGKLELQAQAKLLKLLEDRSVRRLGSVRAHSVDLRVITATNRSLQQLVTEGRFRSDLLYRLNTVTVEVPPLRARGNDVALLAHRFVAELSGKYQKQGLRLSEAAVACLQGYHWPGNVRELRNVVEQAVLHCDGEVIEAGQVPLPGSRQVEPALRGPYIAEVARTGGDVRLQDIEREAIRRALAETGGNVSEASRRLGISRDQLRYRIAKYDLGPRS